MTDQTAAIPPQTAPAGAVLHGSEWSRVWLRFRRRKLAVAAGWFLALLFAWLLLWPLLQQPWARSIFPDALTHSPNALSGPQFAPPQWKHWMGTDSNGRDLLSRVCYGSRISLLVGLAGAAVSLVIGVCWGAAAGYLGGRWDNLLMRIVDILYSLPSIIFVIVLITTLELLWRNWLEQRFSPEAGANTRLLFLFAGLGAVSWLTMARIVRGQVLSLKHRPFVEAARVLGAGHSRVIFRHILPNVTGVIMVYLMLIIPAVILYESFLSYLGLGIQPPQASLGSLIADGASQINPLRVYWWMIFFPAFTLLITLLSLNFLGDGLKEAVEETSD